MKVANQMTGKRVLVTGAGGFVGSHLVERLIDLGFEVRAFLRYTSTSEAQFLNTLPPDKHAGLDIFAGNLCDASSVHHAMSGINLVFHLGAQIGTPYSHRYPSETVTTNMIGTLNTLTACRDSGIERIVYVSTGEVYGTARYVPVDEQHILQAQSPYAASKIGAEKLVESFYAAYDLPTIIVRPFNIYGPRQTARAIIPTIISQALFSSKIQLGNSASTRDFTYVQDAVTALIRASEKDEAIGTILNIGSGREISISGLVELVAHISNKKLSILRDEERFRPGRSEVKRLWANTARARDILDWKPEISLEEGLRITMEWIKGHLEHYCIGEYQV